MKSRISTWALAGVSIGVSLAVSTASLTSISTVWIVLYQMRALLLLLLTRAYIPKDVKDFIIGFKLLSFDFAFLQVNTYPGVKNVIEWLDSPQTDSTFEEVGVKSNSALVNLSGLIFTIT